jgi:hypothetical protein
MLRAHECIFCGASDLLKDIQVDPYTCRWCFRAREMALFLSDNAKLEFQQWQTMMMSRFLRAKDAERP